MSIKCRDNIEKYRLILDIVINHRRPNKDGCQGAFDGLIGNPAGKGIFPKFFDDFIFYSHDFFSILCCSIMTMREKT